MTTVVVSEFIAESALAMLAAEVDVVYGPDLHADRTQLCLVLVDAAALVVRNQTIVDVELMNAAPKLVAVGRLGAGLDNIDVAAIADRGVALFTGAGLNAIAVAEYVVAAALSLTRRAFDATAPILGGAWPRAELVGGEIAGRSMGIVGFGSAGQAVAGRATALGMACFASDPLLPPDDTAWELAESSDISGVLACDIVSLHLPLTDETRHLIDAAAIDRMSDDAILINTSRGGVVDLDAVADALRSGRLGGAALDVLPDEPPSEATLDRLRETPNLIVTPHIAGVTVESNERISAHIATAILGAVT